MPELPEVETSLRGVEPYLVGQTIKAIVLRVPKLRWAIPHALTEMSGAIIQRLSRRAKYLILHTNQGDILIHLGMSGSLSILHLEDEIAPNKHDHVDLITESGVVLRYNDPRKFGCWLWAEDASEHELIQKLGPEPLSEAFNADYLFKKSRGKSVAVKNFIMNNDIIGKNIRKFRELKGYSQEYMANEMELTQASYAKLESNSTKISVERLFTIAKLLETDVADILELNKQTIYHQDIKEHSIGHQEVQNLHQDNKEVYEKLLQSKDEQIALLKSLLSQYIKL